MLHPLFDIIPLKEQIESAAVIITANNRLANKIRQAWGQHQANNGVTCWQQPEIYALESWLQESWQQVCDGGFGEVVGALISPPQEQWLWEQAIANDPEKSPLLQPSNCARQARQAYRIVQQWQISDAELATDSTLFCRWLNSFRKAADSHRLVTLSDCAKQVIAAFEAQQLTKNNQAILVGFQTLSPLYQQLLDSAFTSVSHQTQSSTEAALHHVSLYHETAELTAAAIWATKKLAENPQQRIGIVVSGLARLRPIVERLFREQLQPNYSQPHAANSATPFNISAGVPLAEMPLINTAFALLSLNKRELPLADFCYLLNMPFWGYQPALTARANTENRLRQQAKFNLRCNEFRYQLHKAEEQQTPSEQPSLSSQLEQFETLRREAPSTASLQDWAELFNTQLNAVNWPGDRGLDSIEYQQIQHWQTLLEQLVSLDQLKIKVPFSEVFRQLQLLANNLPFQAETVDSPIQILGTLEATGLHFDHLWIMGMDDRKWPQPCQLNPLLSNLLQRQHQTPRALPEKELSLAQQLLDGFCHSADELIFSHSRFEGEQELRRSALIENVPEIDLEQLLPNADLTVNYYNQTPSAPLETIDCSSGPALTIGSEPIRGGSSIFEAQAACPFNAFAQHRLGAKQPPEPSLGLSPMDRGTLLHRCMEIVWQQLGDQQTLLSLSEDDLNQLLDQSINEALRETQKTRPDLLGTRFGEIEKQRLHHLISQWLEVEKQRPPFVVVKKESRHQVGFAGLPLTLRIDRVDETNSGQQIIIDYKTGSTNSKNWLNERPGQPQLPLYALTSEKTVAAVAFAKINVSEQCFDGIGVQANLLPNITGADSLNTFDSWQALLDHWEKELTLLANEFKNGNADVVFYNKAALQYQTELLPLNRWPEHTALTDNEEPS